MKANLVINFPFKSRLNNNVIELQRFVLANQSFQNQIDGTANYYLFEGSYRFKIFPQSKLFS